MKEKQWTEALSKCFQGLMKQEDRLHLMAPWDRKHVIDTFAWHKVIPIVRELSLCSPSHKVPEFQSIFREERIRHLLRDEIIFLQLKEIVDAFNKAGIEFMILKGPFWAEQVYPSALWRHLGDIDLLVKPAAKRAAIDIIREIGYKPEIISPTLEDELNYRGEVMFCYQDDTNKLKVPVELHWQPLPSPRFIKNIPMETEDFFSMSRPVLYRGVRLLLPGPELRFGFFVVHGICQHQLKRFLPILDMAHLLDSKDDFDFGFLIELMVKWKTMISLFIGLKALRMFGYREERVSEILCRIEKVMPWQTRMFGKTLSPDAIVLSYSGKGYYLRKIMRVLASKPCAIKK